MDPDPDPALFGFQDTNKKKVFLKVLDVLFLGLKAFPVASDVLA
jgi:hypothetical protein